MTTKVTPLGGSLPRRRTVASAAQRRWIQIALITLGVAVVLAGAVTIGSTKLGLVFVVGLYAIIAGIMIAVRPSIGVYILAAFVYLNFSDILEVQFGIASINKVLVGLVFVSALANRLVIQKKSFIFRRTELLVLIYCLVLLFSTFVAEDRSRAQTGAVDALKDFIIMLIVVQVCDNEQSWRNLRWTILFSAAFVATLSAYQVLSKDTSNDFFGLANAPTHEITAGFDSTRVTGPLSDPNYYGQILLMIMPIGIYGIITEKRTLQRLLYLGTTSVIMLTTIFTYSRGAFIALVVMGVMIVHERKLNPYRIVVGVVIIIALLYPFLPQGYLDRLLTLSDVLPQDTTMQTEKSFKGRSSEMIIAIQMFANHPLLGIGYLNYENHYADYNAVLGLDDRAGAREAHDLYLEVLSETGVVGFISFIGLLIGVFVGIHRAMRQFRLVGREDLVPLMAAIEAGLVSYLATSIFLHGAYIRYLWLLVAVALGGMVLAETLVQQRRETLRVKEDGLYVQRELIAAGPQI